MTSIGRRLGNGGSRTSATGAVLRIELGQPIGGEETSGVRYFCQRDGRLVLLAEPGTSRPSSTIRHGAIVGRKLGASDAPGVIR